MNKHDNIVVVTCTIQDDENIVRVDRYYSINREHIVFKALCDLSVESISESILNWTGIALYDASIIDTTANAIKFVAKY